MKIIVTGLESLLHAVMNAVAPEGTPPRRINDEEICLPAVPRRGPEAEISRIKCVFKMIFLRFWKI